MKIKSLKMKWIGFAAAVVLALPVGAVTVSSVTTVDSTAQAGASTEWNCPPDC